MHLQLNSINFQSISFNDSKFMSGHKSGAPRDALGIFSHLARLDERMGQVHPYRWSLKVLGLPVCVASAEGYLLSPAVRGNAN